MKHLLLTGAAIGAALPAMADVRVTRGPSPIPDGEALAAGDITLANDRLAVTLAVDSQAPWGVPRGAIVDLAAVKDGQPDLDRIAFADFIPNNWSSWPNTRTEAEIVTDTPQKAVVRIVRDFGAAEIDTTYTLENGSDRIHLTTTMTNNGDAAMDGLLSGFTLWPDSGYLFPVPGVAESDDKSAAGALADRVVAYDRDWFIALHAPYFDHVDYDTKDLYLGHDLAPGESRSFEGWLQVGPTGDLAPVLAAEIARGTPGSGTLTGTIESSGTLVKQSVLVVEKSGTPYAWTLTPDGNYQIPLPAGDYSVYATAAGYSQSAPRSVTLTQGQSAALDFEDLQPPGTLRFNVTDGEGQPRDARIEIAEGQAPLVEFLGRRTFFTELDDIGHVEAQLAPGEYVFSVGHGAGFLGLAQQVPATVEAGAASDIDVTLDLVAQPQEDGWLASDMHHHADQLEGTTPPEWVARSELAAGLDVIFVSDHDSTANYETLASIAEDRDVPFIPSIELSPSWGHFNAYPLDLDAELQVDTSTATAAEILAEARRMGADAIQSNHPFIPYGYLASLEAGTVPGGFASDIDLLELNGPDDDARVFERAGHLWSRGQRIYLSGGSDAHDVWNDATGSARAYVHVPGQPSAEGFVAGLKDGHAYVTRGPLIAPDVMFGSALRIAPGTERSVAFDLTAVNGLVRATLTGPDGQIASQDFADSPMASTASFTVTATPRDGTDWIALTVEDAEGKMAFTNPIWINPISVEAITAAE
nr:CehA/McbA family metallohydrolase [Oceaniovalibus guishaninsula]